MTRTVVIRAPNWIGDFIMALPALEATRRLFPEARLRVQVHDRCAELARRLSFLDDVIGLPAIADLRRVRDSLGLLFTPSFSSALLFRLAGLRDRVGWGGEARSFLLTRVVPRPDRNTHQSQHFLGLVRAVGFEGPDPPLQFTPSPGDESAAENWLEARGLGDRKLFALAPVVAYGSAKMWPAERFRELARRLVGGGAAVIVAGASGEVDCLRDVSRDIEQVHLLAGDLSLPEVAALFRRCCGFAGNDSGLLHLARAVGTPVVGIYGSTNPRWTGPDQAEGRIATLNLACSPCYRKECPLRENRLACLTGLAVDTVENALRAVAS